MATTRTDGDRKTPTSRVKEEDLMRALPSRSHGREVRVGLFVLLGITAFLIIIFTMTDVGTFRGRYYVRTTIANAGGMRKGDPVQMRGVNIGRVTEFKMVPNGVGVLMELQNEYPVPADSRAEVKSNGLLGGMVIDVVPGSATKRVDDYGTIPGESTGTDIMAQATTLGNRADTTLARINTILSERNVGSMSSSIGSVQASTRELQTLMAQLNSIAAQQRVQLAAISSSLRRSAAGVEAVTAGPELQRSVQHIDSLTAQLDATTRSFNQAGAQLLAVVSRVNRGEGSLGKLTQDNQLYDNLNTAASSLNALITDIQNNPKKYINVRVF